MPKGASLLPCHIKSLSVFVSVPTSESKGGDSNPTALLTDYSSNHSFSSSDNLLPQGMISPSHWPSKAVPYSVLSPNSGISAPFGTMSFHHCH